MFMKIKIVYHDGTSAAVVWPASTTLEYAKNFYEEFKGVVSGLEILSFFKEAANETL